MTKEYVGIIIDDKDPQKLGRYKVKIPELFMTDDEHAGIWALNKVGNYQRYKKGNKVVSAGTYFPLKKDMMVKVKTFTDSLIYAEITELVSRDKIPTKAEGRDTYHQVIKTEDGTFCYYDEKKKLFSLFVDWGSQAYMIHKDKMEFYSGENINNGTRGVKKKKTVFKMTPQGYTISNDNSFVELQDNVVEMRVARDTYFKMHKDGIEMYGKKVKLHGTEEINIYSGKLVRIQGEDEMHILSNETRITGYQTALLASNFVKINGAHHIYQVSDNNHIISKKLTEMSSNDIDMNSKKLNITNTATSMDSKIVGITGVLATAKPALSPKFKDTGAGTSVANSTKSTCNSSVKSKKQQRKAKDTSCLSTNNREAAKNNCCKNECNIAEKADKCEKPDRAMPDNACHNVSLNVTDACKYDSDECNAKRFKC